MDFQGIRIEEKKKKNLIWGIVGLYTGYSRVIYGLYTGYIRVNRANMQSDILWEWSKGWKLYYAVYQYYVKNQQKFNHLENEEEDRSIYTSKCKCRKEYWPKKALRYKQIRLKFNWRIWIQVALRECLKIYPLARKCCILATNSLNFSSNCPIRLQNLPFPSKIIPLHYPKQNLNILFVR